MKYGGTNGYLDLFIKDSSYASSGSTPTRRTPTPRAIQAAYWADTWAKAPRAALGGCPPRVAKAGKMGDYLRYSFFDKVLQEDRQPATRPRSCAARHGQGQRALPAVA